MLSHITPSWGQLQPEPTQGAAMATMLGKHSGQFITQPPSLPPPAGAAPTPLTCSSLLLSSLPPRFISILNVTEGPTSS